MHGFILGLRNMKGEKKMKVFKKILLILLILISVAAAALLMWKVIFPFLGFVFEKIFTFIPNLLS